LSWLKYEGIDFTPPEGAREAAKRALDVRETKPPSQRGMTPVGIARARDLINGVKLSPDTVKRMLNFLTRHEVDKKGATWDEQGKGWQAWNGWGGDAGYAWARKVVGQMEAMDKKELARPGPKSAASTPAPPKERIKGSKENPEGTASTKSKAGDIEISEQNEEALKNKIAEFKDKHPTRKAPTLGALKKVFRRGAGAFSTSFRPTITGGKPNSRNAWAMARVNKFLKMAGGGEVKESYRKADGDLLEERFDCGTGAGGFKEGNTCAGGGGGESFNDIGATWRNSENTEKAKQKFDALSDDAIVTVYHGTTKENAESLIKSKKVSVPSGYKSDLPTIGKDSLYIAPTIADAKKYGNEVVEIKIRKKDMFPSPEAKELNPKVSIGKAFFNSFDGAILNRGQSFEGIKKIDNKE
jgi:hypothetical protein